MLQAHVPAPREHNRVVLVNVRVARATAEQCDRAVEERAVSVGSIAQLKKELLQLLDEEAIVLSPACVPSFGAGRMAEIVMRR